MGSSRRSQVHRIGLCPIYYCSRSLIRNSHRRQHTGRHILNPNRAHPARRTACLTRRLSPCVTLSGCSAEIPKLAGAGEESPVLPTTVHSRGLGNKHLQPSEIVLAQGDPIMVNKGVAQHSVIHSFIQDLRASVQISRRTVHCGKNLAKHVDFTSNDTACDPRKWSIQSCSVPFPHGAP